MSLTASPSEDVSAPALTSRLLTRRMALSLVATFAIVAVAVWRADIPWSTTWDNIRHADVRLYVAAIAVYYLSFVVRAVRWEVLLRNAGEHCRPTILFETLLVSFFVNCVVPAKMGDVYRAFLLRTRERVGAMKAFGTIIAERLLDLFVLMALAVVALVATFRTRVPAQLLPFIAGGAALSLVGIGAVALMVTGRGRRILRLFPDPVVQRYESFRAGTVGSFGRWPAVITLSVAVWGLEAGRLGFVVFALGHNDVRPSNFLLVALVAALLTTIPFTPGGIGLVEGGMAVVLTLVAGVSKPDAVSIALLDRSISYLSLVLVGAVVFAAMHVRVTRPGPATQADSGGA